MTSPLRLLVLGLALAAANAVSASAQSFYSAIRIQATPRDAQVFLDGYLVGHVDDFDGFLQGIRTQSGEHEIEIFNEGYRSFRQKVFLEPGRTLHIRHTLEKLRPGDTPDSAPVPSSQPSPRDPRHAPAPSAPEGRERRQPPAPSGVEGRDYGSIAIQVQPSDAEVFIDGERWNGAHGEALVVEVPAGRRHVEIRRTGRQSYSRDVDVRAGQTTTLNVSLRTQ